MSYLISSFDGANHHDYISGIVGADISNRGKCTFLWLAADLGDSVSDMIHTIGVLLPCDNSPSILSICRVWDLEGFAFRLVSGKVIDDVRNQPLSKGVACRHDIGVFCGDDVNNCGFRVEDVW